MQRANCDWVLINNEEKRNQCYDVLRRKIDITISAIINSLAYVYNKYTHSHAHAHDPQHMTHVHSHKHIKYTTVRLVNNCVKIKAIKTHYSHAIKKKKRSATPDRQFCSMKYTLRSNQRAKHVWLYLNKDNENPIELLNFVGFSCHRKYSTK